MSDNTTPQSTSPLTIAAFQQHIRDRYYETDAERGTPGTFMWLIEEIGELSTTLHKVNGQGGDTSGGSTHEDLESEFADVIAWLTTLANINNVDLETALHKKYFQNGGPKGTK
ncbi:nucleotide pyrophosphohydrolase [Planctomycetota bacterium]|nr:nucleotide pyrophosphohydrolase [Planctomycetota bacterium]